MSRRPERLADLFPGVVADLAARHNTTNGAPMTAGDDTFPGPLKLPATTPEPEYRWYPHLNRDQLEAQLAARETAAAAAQADAAQFPRTTNDAEDRLRFAAVKAAGAAHLRWELENYGRTEAEWTQHPAHQADEGWAR